MLTFFLFILVAACVSRNDLSGRQNSETTASSYPCDQHRDGATPGQDAPVRVKPSASFHLSPGHPDCRPSYVTTRRESKLLA